MHWFDFAVGYAGVVGAVTFIRRLRPQPRHRRSRWHSFAVPPARPSGTGTPTDFDG